MKIDELGDILDSQLGNYYNTILVNGSWGIGKSHYINEYSKNNHAYKVSMFGIDSVSDFKYAIAYSINCKEANIHKILTQKNESTIIQLPFLSIPIPKLQEDFDSIIINSLDDKKKHILIIDDLERKSDSISLKDIFGIITDLSEVNNLNIIIIVNDQYVSDLNEDDSKVYKEFNEKVIERIYNVSSYSDSALNNICGELIYEDGREYLIDLYTKSRELNLRTLIKTVKFFNLLYSSFNFKNINDDVIIKILECVLVMMITINSNDFSNDKSINSQINTLLWKDSVEKRNELYIVSSLYKIYLTNDFSIIDEIMQLFVVKEMVEPEKDLFYCSCDELVERAKYFKNNVMNIYNPNYNLLLLLKDISLFKDYLSKYNCDYKISNKEINESIDLYIRNTNYNYDDLFNFINRLKTSVYITDRKSLKYACDKVIGYYINNCIKSIISEKCKLNVINIKNLYCVITSNLIDDIKSYKKEINIIYKNKFFVPDFNGSINESVWEIVHEIFDKIHYLGSDNLLRIKFVELLKNEFDNCSPEGKYRLESLIEQYSFNIDCRL